MERLIGTRPLLFKILCVFSRVDAAAAAAARHHHLVAVVVFFFSFILQLIAVLLEKRREMREKAPQVDALRLSLLLLFNLCRRLFFTGRNHQDISRASC